MSAKSIHSSHLRKFTSLKILEYPRWLTLCIPKNIWFWPDVSSVYLEITLYYWIFWSVVSLWTFAVVDLFQKSSWQLILLKSSLSLIQFERDLQITFWYTGCHEKNAKAICFRFINGIKNLIQKMNFDTKIIKLVLVEAML
jgi:hypothetical protein